VAAYCFDDEVIFDLRSATRSAAAMAVEELWSRVGTDAALALTVDRVLEVLVEARWELRGRVDAGAQVTLAGFERLLDEIGVDETGLALQVDAMYREHRGRVVEPFDDADHLRVLRQRHRIGLVVGQGIEWRALGEGVVDVAVRPGQLRLDRSDPALLGHVADALGVDQLTVVAGPMAPLRRGAKSAGFHVEVVDRLRGEGIRSL
jgi:hypothetical protein